MRAERLGMNPVALLFSPSGRLAPRAFWTAVAVVYLVGFASQALLSPPVTLRAGLWPFAAAQPVLIWSWYALHAKRLRDAGLAVGTAAGIAALAGLAVLLLLLILTVVLEAGMPPSAVEEGSGLLAFFVLFSLIALASGALGMGLFGLVAGVLLVVALLPVVSALALSVWAGTRPSTAA
jgi:uncharacterized membrane protein YhaH (DUF805 family)